MSEESKPTTPKEEATTEKAVEDSKGTVVTESQETKLNSKKNNSNHHKSPQMIIDQFEKSQQKEKIPEIYVGDTVKVGVRISEGNKERVQPYEGVIIAKRHGGLNQTITVRRIFQGIGVERIFMVHSPQVASIKVERRGKVRRAKLFYLRDRVGKATRVKQRFDR